MSNRFSRVTDPYPFPSPFYTLVGQTPVPTEDVFEWAKLLEDINSRRVRETYIGDVYISTVFLGLDHAFFEGPPLLFETMVFWPDLGGEEQARCATWLEAEAQHAAMLRYVMTPAAVWGYCKRTLASTLREAFAELQRLGS